MIVVKLKSFSIEPGLSDGCYFRIDDWAENSIGEPVFEAMNHANFAATQYGFRTVLHDNNLEMFKLHKEGKPVPPEILCDPLPTDGTEGYNDVLYGHTTDRYKSGPETYGHCIHVSEVGETATVEEKRECPQKDCKQEADWFLFSDHMAVWCRWDGWQSAKLKKEEGKSGPAKKSAKKRSKKGRKRR